ncbi:hypothetical protein [Alkalitalea saponilacus]|uniref:SpoIIAA-like n=1 Tax=Alkalitalea saponilacus TaxID=889453 RepID=A0A1T5HSA7_9BACT|nr:hypothetical protein [Alkalitalea saponilacus]ASB48345.1 hypothetical protein CDL62_03885 [Alkalitalea saponilacus]SKC23569.1 hypothetical protein SAMN03080601_02845 [Alkalitalea saponilacus]
MELYKDQNVVLRYDDERKELLQVWSGFVPAALFRVIIDISTEFIAKNNVDSLISDVTEQKVVSPDDAQYAASALPEMMQYGLKVMAFVIPKDVFTRLSLKKFSDFGRDKPIGYFNSLPEARQWIKVLLDTPVNKTSGEELP